MGSTTSDQAGNFFLSYTLAGYDSGTAEPTLRSVMEYGLRQRLLAGHPDFGDYTLDLTLQPVRTGQEEYRVDGIVLRLSAPHVLRVEVSDETGAPLAAQVSLASLYEMGLPATRTLADGSALTANTDVDGVAVLKLPTVVSGEPSFVLWEADLLLVAADGYANELAEVPRDRLTQPGTTTVKVVCRQRGRDVRIHFQDTFGRPLKTETCKLVEGNERRLGRYTDGWAEGDTRFRWLPNQSDNPLKIDSEGWAILHDVPRQHVLMVADFRADVMFAYENGNRGRDGLLDIPSDVDEVVVTIQHLINVNLVDAQGNSLQGSCMDVFRSDAEGGKGERADGWDVADASASSFALIPPDGLSGSTTESYLLELSIDGWASAVFVPVELSGSEINCTVKVPMPTTGVAIEVAVAGPKMWGMEIRSEDPDAGIDQRVWQDDDGCYRLKMVPAGKYQLEIDGGRAGTWTTSIDVTDSPAVQRFDLKWTTPGRKVSFLAQSSPPGGSWVNQLICEPQFQPDAPSPAVRETSRPSDADVPVSDDRMSVVVLDGVPETDAVVALATNYFVLGPGRHTGLEVNVPADADESSKIELPSPDWLSVTITASDHNQAVGACDLTLVRLGDGVPLPLEGADRAAFFESAWVDGSYHHTANGKLDIPAVAAGSYVVIAWMPGNEVRLGFITISHSGEQLTVELE